jgi:plasmid replication initiation protein
MEKQKYTQEEKAPFNLAKKDKTKKVYRKPYKKKEFIHQVDFSEKKQAPVAKDPVKNIFNKLWKFFLGEH